MGQETFLNNAMKKANDNEVGLLHGKRSRIYQEIQAEKNVAEDIKVGSSAWGYSSVWGYRIT